ncbi:MAG: amidase [Pseudomonadota bacterium]
MRILLAVLTLLSVAACSRATIELEETSIADLHDRIQRGELSSEDITSWYLQRIERLDRNGPALNSVIELNPDALTIARSLDEEWRQSGPRGPLHGIPVLLKANIDTADRMKTSAGSLALAEHVASEDAFLVRRLRDAGAVILGKTNLSEWANFRSSMSSSGWSSAGGQTHNPYDTARNPCGSSSGSGVAVAANLTSVAVGTETDGSILCPSGVNGIVGIKPTLGLISRSGIIPIAHSQDTAGPMARSVRDAALLLSVMTGSDPRDPASAALPEDVARGASDYTANLAADRLKGRRIGVLRSYYGSGEHPEVERVFTASIAALAAGGAEIVDPLMLDTGAAGAHEYTVLLYEFKHGVAQYLEQSGTAYTSLSELIDFNTANAEQVMPLFGQDIFLEANAKGPLSDADYTNALSESKRLTQTALNTAFEEHGLDAIVAPSNGPAWMTDHVNGDSFSVGSSSFAAISGYPSVTVPAGFAHGLPLGLSFIGRPFSEQALLELAYAFEQTTLARRPPPLD